MSSKGRYVKDERLVLKGASLQGIVSIKDCFVYFIKIYSDYLKLQHDRYRVFIFV